VLEEVGAAPALIDAVLQQAAAAATAV
jgi:hypothetical protein